MNKKICCIDFDGTLCYNAYENIWKAKRNFMHKLIMWYCKRLQKKGWLIVLNTLRKDQKLKYAIEYLKVFNFTPDLINENAKFLIDKWGESRKIACDLNIDDRNIGLIGWLLRRYK